jgi:hypothetical protein
MIVIFINFIFCPNIIYFCSVKLDFSISYKESGFKIITINWNWIHVLFMMYDVYWYCQMKKKRMIMKILKKEWFIWKFEKRGDSREKGGGGNVSSSPLFSTIPPFLKFSYKSFLFQNFHNHSFFLHLTISVDVIHHEKTNDYENFEKGMIYMKIWEKGG